MDDRHDRVASTEQDQAGRRQQMSLVQAVMVCVVMLILLQTLMLNIAVEGYLGGVEKVILPATVGSALCFAGSCWLIAYIRRTNSR